MTYIANESLKNYFWDFEKKLLPELFIGTCIILRYIHHWTQTNLTQCAWLVRFTSKAHEIYGIRRKWIIEKLLLRFIKKLPELLTGFYCGSTSYSNVLCRTRWIDMVCSKTWNGDNDIKSKWISQNLLPWFLETFGIILSSGISYVTFWWTDGQNW